MKSGAVLALSAGLLAAPVCAEPAWSVEVAGQQEWQQWRESAGDGRRLVAEDGRLGGLAASLRWHGEMAAVGLRAGALRGVRDYRGVTNLGSAADTRSNATHGFVRLEGVLPVRWPLAGWQWQPLAAAEGWHWSRHLRDVGLARGYQERYRQGLLLLGLQARNESGWLAQLEAGGGAGGHNRVELPGRDVARLPLGEVRSWRATLGAPLLPDWRWQLSADHLTVGAGEERVITLQGVPVQSAHQPRTSLRRLQLQLSWER